MLEIFEENGNSGAYSECGCGCGCNCPCFVDPIERVFDYNSVTKSVREDLYRIVEENYRTAG